MPRTSRRSSRRRIPARAQKLGANDKERRQSCREEGRVYQGKPQYNCMTKRRTFDASKHTRNKSGRLVSKGRSAYAKANPNPYFEAMLEAKASGAKSFVYNGMTYKAMKGKNGLVLYKKASSARRSRRVRGGEYDEYYM